MSAQSIPTHSVIGKAARTKTLICKKNHKLLKEYGIIKGQIVQIENDLLVKYYNKEMKQFIYVKLSKKLMKYFKE